MKSRGFLAARWGLVAALFLIASVSPSHAQANITGTVRGYVADDSGNFLPGASVTMFGESLGTAGRTAITDLEGAFSFDAVPVGTYSLKTVMIGYRPYEIVQIVVNPDETRTFNVVLVEGLTERVVVVAERTAVDTTNTSTHEVLDASYVNKLPLISRRYQQILTLFPGVSNAGGYTLAQYHVNGGRETQNGFRLDGANINDFVTGTFGLNINQNAIERFELNTSGYQAEYGEQSGGIANIVTKSGTNTFELLYSGFYRSDAFSANTPGARQLWKTSDADGTTSNNHLARPETQDWQELAVGGPLIKNKLFFFTSFQYWQEDIGSLFNNSMRQGDRYHGQFKLTWQATPTNTVVANVATDPSQFKNLITDARYAEGTNFNQSQGGYFVQVRDTQNLSSRTFLESQLYVQHGYLAVRPADTGLGTYTITFDPSAPTTFTGTYPNDQDRTTYRSRASSSITTQMGSHRLKSGFDYSWMEFSGANRTNNTVIDASAYLGPGNTLTYTYDYNKTDRTHRKDSELGAFVQDTWILDEHWTVEGGLRLDHQSVLGQSNVAPRLGVAVDPAANGKSKIYGNWGRFYDNVFTSFIDSQRADGYTVRQTFVQPPTTYQYNVVTAVVEYAADGKLQAPYKDSYTLGYERELPWDMRIGASTTHWKGYDQLRVTQTNDLASVPSSVNLSPSATGAIIFDSLGRNQYDDWKVMVRKAFSHRLEVLASYTRSRALGDSSADFGLENRADQRSLDYTRLSYDRPNLMNLSAFLSLPWGMEVTGIARYQSGRLYSPVVFQSGGFVIDTAVGGKNSQRMPAVESLDMSISKRLQFGGSQLRLTAQCFNVTNHLNAVAVETNPNAKGFRSPVDTDFGRIFQFGAEMRF
ncbi:MAG: TonB-dependent receptor [Acidobacteria bacterium]|nr:TonB-dependent receptor [Acidobacteriota bacterium]